MTSRLLAAAVLLAAAFMAWLAVTIPMAARTLQVTVGASVVYVGYLAWRGWAVMRREMALGRSGAGASTGVAVGAPWISVLVPARNEAAVIAASVGDLLAQRYADASGPHFDLLVVDDGSSDGTGELARQAIEGSSVSARVIRREPGSGPLTKAAVLAFAQPFFRGEVVGVIDADTRIGPDFLERVARAWGRDPTAAAVQVQRRVAAGQPGWLPAAQDAEQLMDMASQCGRRATDGTAELRGNGMFVRVAALAGVGGWNARALTEDLDLSTRLAAAGEHVALAPDAELREEAVVTLGDLWRQRLRWAEGGLRRILEIGPGLLRSPDLALTRKLDFLAFAGEYLIPPLFVAALVASIITIPVPGPADWTVPLSLFVAYGGGSLMLALAGLSAHGVRGRALLWGSLRGALFLSHWLLVVTTALIRIALGRGAEQFVQTPRRGAPSQV